MTATMALPTWRDWLFSAKAFLASMLALWIALAAGLSRPYWAMAAVYVVANPLSGATTSKALYRALGTLLGAAGSILLLPPLADTPELFSLAVALWTGGFLFVSLLDRTPRSYVFMLAGYSLPLIALPAVSEPGTIFDVAVARTEEITLGIVCASLVFALVFPVRVGPVLGARAAAWLRDAGDWARAILQREEAAGATRERQRLAADIRAMDILIGQIAYDAATPVATRQARELRGRMAVLLPILSSLADRLGAVRANGGEPAGLVAVTADISAWMAAGPDAAPDEADRLQQALAALEPRGEAARAWDGLVLSSTLERLKELVDLWHDCRTLQRRITLGHRAGRWKPAFRHRRTVGARPHYDFGLLVFSAGSVVLATLAACFVWIATGWEQGAGCVIMTAVGCSFFAALDNPAPQIRGFVVWMAASVVASAVYLFAVLPAVHDFPMLVMVFAVPFLLVGTLVTRPQFTMIAMLLAVNTASFVGLQASYSADFAAFANSNVASVAGGLFGLVWSLVTRPFGAAFAARRLVRAGWANIAATARGGANQDPAVFAGRVFDRLGQLVPRLAETADPDVASADVLAELRIGMNILDLQRIRPTLPAGLHPCLDAVLDGVAAAFARRVTTGRAEPPPDSLLDTLDDALAAFTEARIGAGERTALQALVGLRRALHPRAPGPLRLGPAVAPLPVAAE